MDTPSLADPRWTLASEGPCGLFTVVDGTGGGASSAWFSDGDIVVKFDRIEDTRAMIVTTQCGPIMVPYKESGHLLVADVEHAILGAQGCLGDAAVQHTWFLHLVGEEMTAVEVDGGWELHGPARSVKLQNRTVMDSMTVGVEPAGTLIVSPHHSEDGPPSRRSSRADSRRR